MRNQDCYWLLGRRSRQRFGHGFALELKSHGSYGRRASCVCCPSDFNVESADGEIRVSALSGYVRL